MWERFKESLMDIGMALSKWRIWGILAISEVRSRYLRSKLGQFWITLSTGALVGLLGFVWSFLFKVEVSEYLPYVAVGLIFWNFISASRSSGSSAYAQMKSYLIELSLPKSVPFFYSITKEASVLLHNLVIVLVALLVFQVDFSWSTLMVIPGFLLLLLLLLGVSMIVAPLGARFADFHNLVGVGVTMLFYFTPILWKIDIISNETVRSVLKLNPISLQLDLIRIPLLGGVVPASDYLVATATAISVLLVGLCVFTFFRRKIGYWL